MATVDCQIAAIFEIAARDREIHLSPRTQRHTRLRQLAREKGIEFAVELSGHKSSKYIWRFIQADDEEMEAAMADPWE